MITGAILDLLYNFISWVLSPIFNASDVSLPAGIASAFSTIGGYLGSLDNFFPVATLLTVVGTITAIEAGVMIYKIAMWLIRKIPGIG